MSSQSTSNNQLVKMADAAARREARRKRILENSHNRLQRISGKNEDEGDRESTNNSPLPQVYETPMTTDSDLLSSFPLINGLLGPEVETLLLSSRHDVVAAGDGDPVNEFAPFAPPTVPEQNQTPIWTTLLNNKFDIVVLSLLLQLIHGLSSVPSENTYFFLPLMIYTATKIIWFPNQSNSSIANALLLLNNMSANRLHKMFQILQVMGTIGQDVSVYLFTMICTQTLFTILKDNFVT